MKLHTPRGLISQPVHFNLHFYPSPHKCTPPEYDFRQYSDGDSKLGSPEKHRRNCISAGRNADSDDFSSVSIKKTKKHRRSIISAGQISEFDDCGDDKRRRDSIARRRDVIVAPLIAIGASVLKSAVARADEKSPESVASATSTPATQAVVAVEKKEEVITSRIYDASAIGEPMALGKDKTKVWEKLMNARIVYLGEAEQVPIRDDKELELEILKNLRKKCFEVERSISLALEAFPCNLQDQLDKFVDGR